MTPPLHPREPPIDRPLHRLVWRISEYLRIHVGSRAPERLIDPDGEGAYFLRPNLRLIAFEYGADDWRSLTCEYVWMRPHDDEMWVRSEWRRRDAFKLPRWEPALFTYVCPPNEAP